MTTAQLNEAVRAKVMLGVKLPVIFRPAEDVADMWQVVTMMRGGMLRWHTFARALKIEVQLDRPTNSVTVRYNEVWRFATPAHICRAALKVAESGAVLL